MLSGGFGFDTLTGGVGADRFSGSLVELNGDRITDFEAVDVIHLNNSLASASQVQLASQVPTPNSDRRRQQRQLRDAYHPLPQPSGAKLFLGGLNNNELRIAYQAVV